MFLPRVDPAANTASTSLYHNQLSPLGIAIGLNEMDLWQILRQHTELSDEAKMEQLFFMISQTRGQPFPQEQFKELLTSLPVEKVNSVVFADLIFGFKVSTTYVLGKSSLLQAAVTFNNKEPVSLLLEYG